MTCTFVPSHGGGAAARSSPPHHEYPLTGELFRFAVTAGVPGSGLLAADPPAATAFSTSVTPRPGRLSGQWPVRSTPP